MRDRLTILAESDARMWLDPSVDRELLEIEGTVRERAVVYFRLDSDRWPLLAAMLAAAIVSDLIPREPSYCLSNGTSSSSAPNR